MSLGRGRTMPTGDRKDPFKGFNFKLEIDRVQKAGFHEASGLDLASAHNASGGRVPSTSKITGLNKTNDVTLKRGVIGDSSLADWLKPPTSASHVGRNVSIVLTDDAGDEKIRWNLVNARPIKFTGPAFRSHAKTTSHSRRDDVIPFGQDRFASNGELAEFSFGRLDASRVEVCI